MEPVSDWKSPDSLQMSLVSYFFKLSMVLRNVHSTLTEDYQVGDARLLDLGIRNWIRV